MVSLGDRWLRSESTLGFGLAATSSCSWVAPSEAVHAIEDEPPTLEFRVEDSPRRAVPAAERDRFEADFRTELANLRKWAAAEQWVLVAPSRLQVFVSDRFEISRSLVPAWYGRGGHMEFPAWRVTARKAAIMHELIHVFLPNGNRLLAEGLAVALQARLGGNPAFPNFGRPLHELARERLSDMAPQCTPGDSKGIEYLRLADLDAIATPSPLALEIGQDFLGEEPRGQTILYAIAGSFVQFLIEAHGMGEFRTLYARTPLVPFEQTPGSPDRWSDVYGRSLADIELEWKSLMVNVGSICSHGTSDGPDPGRTEN